MCVCVLNCSIQSEEESVRERQKHCPTMLSNSEPSVWARAADRYLNIHFLCLFACYFQEEEQALKPRNAKRRKKANTVVDSDSDD